MTAINSGTSTHHSQHRLVIHRSKGSATDLHLPPSIEPSSSAATTDPRINQFHPHQRAVWASPIATKTHDSSLQHPRRQIASSPTAGHSPRHRQIGHPATISHHQ